ncbi:MAG TPA: UDP-galactopyranose mutase, partial [Spongiibacteraceae bacterium]
MNYDVVIIGAGFAGCTCAQILAENGKQILIIEKRGHIGGNAYDCLDEHGIIIHPYGPHIFHTNSERIFRYLSRFTNWVAYEHRVLSFVEKKYLPIPINRTTINRLYDLNLTESEVAEYLDRIRISKEKILNSEDLVLNSVGNDLCEKFFRGYTRKQWGLDLSQLSAGVAARIPTRTNDDDRYFTDKFQYMPQNGYTKMFENMLSSPNIEIALNTDFENVGAEHKGATLIYTGAIDTFYDYRHGKLPYRSLQFKHEHFANTSQYQPAATINYPNDFKFTRTTEFKQITGQKHPGTSVVSEFPCDNGDPYYPIPNASNEALYKRYEQLAKDERNTIFVGRLAQYRYYNMDQVVGAAISAIEH